MSILPGFVKAQSDNLPKICSISMFSFLGKNTDFIGAEIRGIKAQRSGRENYGDNAIGYVQVKRESDMCTVNAKVTPEHSVRKKAYNVTLVCNEVDEEVLSVQCDDCAASLGGCKHAIALLMWIHRRSEEPSVTSVSSYWKKSKLSSVGQSLKFINADDIGRSKVAPLRPKTGLFLKKVLEQSKISDRQDAVLTKYYKEISDVHKLSIHNLLISFFEDQQGSSADEFLNYCSVKMMEEICAEASEQTLEQHENSLWHDLRCARITASKAHQAAHCHTLDGSLVELILGASCFNDTAAMLRGRKLEKDVRKEIEKQKNMKIKKCGFKTSSKFPVMGASPDGISDQYVIEIKCPSTKKAQKNYICDGKLLEKHNAQIQLQMLFSGKQQGLFCVASETFETSKDVTTIVVDFDEQYCMNIVEKCTSFWKDAIFPILKKNFV